MATIIDSILSESDPDKHPNGRPCSCGRCPHCLGNRSASHRTWRERRNARYFGQPTGSGPVARATGQEGEVSRSRATHSPVARKSAPGPASRVVPVRGSQKQAIEKKWTDKMNKARHAGTRDRFARYAETVRNDGRPTADQSEKDLLPLFRGAGMLFYRPDRVIQVLNYNIRAPHALIEVLGRKARAWHGGRHPLVILDLRGQEKSTGSPLRLIDRLAERSGYPAGRIKIVTW